MIDASKVRRIIQERGFTQTDLSERSGISQARISIMLKRNGPVNCYEDTVQKIARALNVDPSVIRPDSYQLPMDSDSLEIANLFSQLDQKTRSIVRTMITSLAKQQEASPNGRDFQFTKEYGRTPHKRTPALSL